MNKQHPTKEDVEQKIVDGIIVTVGGGVALAIIALTPAIPAIIIGKMALEKLQKINRDWFFDLHTS